MRQGSLWIVILLLLVLALCWTWPLAGHLGEAIPYTILPKPGLEMLPLYAGDHLQFYYRLWLFSDSLRHGRPFSPPGYEFNGNMGRNLLSGLYFPLSLVYALFTPLGATAAYNILLLLTFPLTGLSLYLLARAYGAGFWGALAGALTATFIPYRVGQLSGGHPNGFVLFMLPLLLWLVEKYLETGRPRWAWLAGLAFFSQMIMELHAAYYTFILMAVFLPLRWLLPLNRWLEAEITGPLGTAARSGRFLKYLPPAAVFAFRLFQLKSGAYPGWQTAVISASAWGLLVLAFQGLGSAMLGAAFRTDREEAAGLVSPVFMPLVILPLYGLKLLWPIPYLGKGLLILVLACAVLQARSARRRLAAARRLRLRPAGILRGRAEGLVPLGLSIAASLGWVLYLRASLFSGTNLAKGRSLGETVLFTPSVGNAFVRVNHAIEFYLYPGLACLVIIAAALCFGRSKGDGRRAWVPYFFGLTAALSYLFCFGSRGEVILPLYGAIRRLVPYMSYGRVPSRAMLVFVPALAVLVALAADSLVSRCRGRVLAAGLGALLSLAILADLRPAASFGLTRLQKTNRVYEWRSGAGAAGALAEVPIWPGDAAWSSIYQYWVTRYRHRMINGYSPVVPPGYLREVFEPLAGLNVGHAGPEEAALLGRLGVDRLVLHEEVFPSQVSLFPFRATLEGLRASPYLRFILRDGWLWLFEVVSPPPVPPPAGEPGTTGGKSPVGVVFQAESPSMNPARVVAIPQGSAAESLEAGRPALSAPGRLFPPGRFQVTLRLDGRGSAGGRPEARLLIREKDGAGIAETLLELDGQEGSMEDRVVPFEIKEPRRLVFEVFGVNGDTVTVDYLQVLCAGQEDPLRRAEFEDLPHAGRLAEDAGASGGWVVLLEKGTDPPMTFNYGPRRRLTRGSWEVSVRYRRRGGQGEDSVRVREHDGRVLSEANLARGAGGWDEASLPLRLERDAFFDVEVAYSAQSDLLLDKLEVRPR